MLGKRGDQVASFLRYMEFIQYNRTNRPALSGK